MAPHSSTLVWKIPWMEEPDGLQSMGSLESGTTERLHFHFSLSCIGEGNGNPLQCSCLENPRDGGAQWAAVYGVAQSRTRLKQLGRQQQHGYLATAHAHTLLNIILTIYTSQFFETVITIILSFIELSSIVYSSLHSSAISLRLMYFCFC